MQDINRATADKQWFAMRVTYQRELAAKDMLGKIDVECFVPMKRIRKTRTNGKASWEYISALHNYIFIHSDRKTIDDIKKYNIPWLRYIISSTTKTPLTVSDRDMINFITVAGNAQEDIQYLAPEKIDLKKGDKVRVMGGVFEGAEGVFMKIEGSRSKRVVVKIEGLVAVATTAIPSVLIEKI